MTQRIPLYIPEPLDSAPIAQPFWYKFPKKQGSIFNNDGLPRSFFEEYAESVEPERACAIVLPNTFSSSNESIHSYVKKYVDLGQKIGIPVFIFSLGDLNDLVRFDPNAYVFRQSVYRSTMQPQDIVIPTLTGDVGREGITLRSKTSLPVVSFCGQAGYKTVTQEAKYRIKVLIGALQGVFNPLLKARIVGVYWRIKMLDACRNSDVVDTHFIVRRSFSGAHRTIELDPAQARKEFIDSIVNSDFVLAPKGDGNYSNRFLEALSLGRIPVLLDTDTVLPLEDEIDYEQVMVRVPMGRVQDTAKIVRSWYDKHTEEEWKLSQVAARELYARVLRLDSFFSYFFTEILPTLPTSPARATSKPAHRI